MDNSRTSVLAGGLRALLDLGGYNFRAAGSPGGRAWLAALPSLVADLAREWELTVTDGEIRHGYNAVVIRVARAGVPLALKITWPSGDDVRLEAEALAAWHGHGAVGLVAADPARGALLLERLGTGRSLADVPVLEAGAIAGTVLRELAVPAPESVPALRDQANWIASAFVERRHQPDSQVPGDWLTLAARLADALSRDPARLLIHADLHYGNVLAREAPGADDRGWVAIDPRPLAGAPERSAAELLWTRADELAAPEDFVRLLDAIIGGGGLVRGKAVAWSFVRTIDYWLWALDTGLTIDPVRCARVAGALAPLAARVTLA
ncbi:MAG TPA: aminoglycoside phosphotransferase family protein [Trebonia sp.]|nr:aminoglycoside phosphotransferase family protein [Trebonia sp.]